jgi:hypothetical protein
MLMIGYLLCLLLFLAITTNQQEVFLSPVLPPAAFVGEYYTVQFRLVGADRPTFSFTDLPPFLSAYSNGTVEGTPLQPGSFPLTIVYETSAIYSKAAIIVRVLNSSSSSASEATIISSSKFTVLAPSAPLTYIAENHINIFF